MLDPGNLMVSAPYYVAGRNSVTVPAAASRLATLVNFGRVDLTAPTGAALVPVPIRLSRAEIWFSLTSGAALTYAFELVKGTATVQDSANGSQRVVVPRKTTGYPAIANTEVSLYMSTAGTAVSGGNFSAVGEPFLIAGGGFTGVFGFAQGVWTPPDMLPLTLEAGEACALQVTSQGGAAVGVLGVCFHFTRQ